MGDSTDKSGWWRRRSTPDDEGTEVDTSNDLDDLRMMIDAMGEGLLAVSSEGQVDLVNTVICSLLDMDRNEIDGAEWQEIVAIPALLDAVESAMSGRAVTISDIELGSDDGERIVDARAVPRFAPDGRASGALLVIRDVTLARRADAMRRDLLVNVSHELKTPIAALRGMVETMVDDPEMDDDVRNRFLQRMEKQCHRLSTLVTDVLALGAIEATEGTPPQDDVDLIELVAAIVGELAPAADRSGLTVVFQPNAESHNVRGSAELLRQAISNLLVNAVTYSDSGDQVFVRLLARPGGHLLEVEDTGIGIEDQHLTRIFERFYRADPARSRERGGSGLGLSIVKHVSLMHGGDVSVSSVPGEGTIFRLRLPTGIPRADELV